MLALAKGYPFPAPDGSYLFRHGEAEPLAAGSYAAAPYRNRVPVLAHGSNRSPEQLKRKFGDGAEIPVTVGWLTGYDVVYSAHITQYGAVASTLHHAPGVRARVSLNWLSPAQLERMHETEGPSNYRYGRLRRIELRLEAGPARSIADCTVYLSTNGCLERNGAPVGLAAVTAEGRHYDALGQEEALTHVRDRYRPHLGLDDMILRKIRDNALRKALVDEMRAQAVPPEAPHFEESG